MYMNSKNQIQPSSLNTRSCLYATLGLSFIHISTDLARVAWFGRDNETTSHAWQGIKRLCENCGRLVRDVCKTWTLGGSKLSAESDAFNPPKRRRSRLLQVSMILMAGMLCHNDALAAPLALSTPSDTEEKCNPPGFWRNGECWVILQRDEDCVVQPIIMELEDQPMYCPKNKIVSIKRASASVSQPPGRRW